VDEGFLGDQAAVIGAERKEKQDKRNLI